MSKGAQHKFSEIGVRDSKLLTPHRRSILFDAIRSIASEVKTDIIMPADINEAMKKGISLNELEAIRFARLFDTMESNIHSFYIDSPDVIAERFGIRLKMLSSKPTRVIGVKGKRSTNAAKNPVRLIAEHKADTKYPVVSAASIIAKVTRDAEISKLEKKLKFRIGSGYPSDYKTIEAVRSHLYNSKLTEHLRMRWKTLENIKQAKISDFY